MPTLHDTDFYSWTQQQASLLRSGNLAALDIASLIEEIEDMGRSEKRELENRLIILLVHLLKWHYQPKRQGNSWLLTIKVQRKRVDKCLTENPGLKPSRNTVLTSAYDIARLDAAKETKLIESTFSLECPWTFEQVLDNEFLP